MSAESMVSKVEEVFGEDRKSVSRCLGLISTFLVENGYPKQINDKAWRQKMLELDTQILEISQNKLSALDLMTMFFLN
jgi:hypothetical protein